MRQRTTAVVNRNMDDFEAIEVVDYILEQSGSYGLISWELTTKVPVGIDVGTADQLEATRRDAGPDARYLVVWSVIADDDE